MRRWRVKARPPKGREGKNWQLRIRSPEGRETQKTSGTPDPELARERAELEERRRNKETLPFPDVASAYLEHRAALGARAGTLKKYREVLAAVGAALDGRDVCKESVLTVRAELAKRLKRRTAHNYLGMARTAWEWARGEGKVSDAWPILPKPENLEHTNKRRCLPHELDAILREFLTYAGGRYYPFFALLADLGSRTGETCGIRECDIDRDACEIRLKQTKGEPRTVTVSPDVVDILPVRDDPTAYLFQRPRGGPFNSQGVYMVWRRVIAKLGWESRPISPHSLRRAWIIEALDAGAPIRGSMSHVGHKQQRTHVDTYGRNDVRRPAREAAEIVRAGRQPLPHTTPPKPPLDVGVACKLKQEETREEQGARRSGTSSNAPEVNAPPSFQESNHPEASSAAPQAYRQALVELADRLGDLERERLLLILRRDGLSSLLRILDELGTD